MAQPKARKKRAKARAPRGSLRGFGTGPPVTYSKGYGGNTFTFSGGRASGCMRMTGSCKIGEVYGSSGIGGSGTAYVFLTNAAGSISANTNFIYMTPESSLYFTDPMSFFTEPFQKFIIHRGRFRYESASTTLTTGQIVMAYLPDVGYVVQFSSISDGTWGHQLITDTDTVGRLSRSVTFPVWQNGSLEMTKPASGQDLLDCRACGDQTIDLTVGDPNGILALLRQSVQGCFILAGLGIPSAENDDLLGSVFLDYDIELCDLAVYGNNVRSFNGNTGTSSATSSSASSSSSRCKNFRRRPVLGASSDGVQRYPEQRSVSLDRKQTTR